MTEPIDTLVIGAGQAGLSMSWWLQQQGREHLLLERGRIAERWRSERWDALAFQFPNWMLRLPGHAYEGAEPEAFMGRDGIVDFLAGYARRNAAPVRSGVNVSTLTATDHGTLKLTTGQGTMEARNVVVATGPYQQPAVPPFAAVLPPSIAQVTANRYTRPADLAEGGVLVVGSGGSGYQIAEDLAQAGRQVWFSARRHRLIPRRYRGRDIGWWLETMGITEQTADGGAALDFRPPLVTGVGGGRSIDLRLLAAQGVTLLGSLNGAEGNRLSFATDLNANLAAADDTLRQFAALTDAYAAAHRLAVDPPGELDARLATRPPPLPETATLDLRAVGIATVIWATGYRYDFGWIACPVLDPQGAPVQRRGVTSVPGLYFLGLPRMHKVKSAFFWGVGEDAAYIAEHIAARQR